MTGCRVWCVKFNPIHDQLLLSASSDARVLLHAEPGLSSEAGLGQEEGAGLATGVVRVVEEHEESVYTCAWSDADPWTCASLSYDGRVIISRSPPPPSRPHSTTLIVAAGCRVPRRLKYQILQL